MIYLDSRRHLSLYIQNSPSAGQSTWLSTTLEVICLNTVIALVIPQLSVVSDFNILYTRPAHDNLLFHSQHLIIIIRPSQSRPTLMRRSAQCAQCAHLDLNAAI